MSEPKTLTAEVQVTPDTRKLIALGETAADVARSFEIDSPEMAEMVSQRRNETLARIDVLEAKMKEITAPAQQIIKTTQSWFKPSIEACREAATVYAGLLTDWQSRQARLIEEENRAKAEAARKARQEADAKAAAERARAEQIAREERAKAEAAERARQEAEAKARAEHEARAFAQRQAEEEKRAAAEADRRAAEAKARGEVEVQAGEEAQARAARVRQEIAKEAERRAAAEAKAQSEAAARAAAQAAQASERAQAVVDNADQLAVAVRMQAEASVPELARPVGVAGTSFRAKWIAVLKDGVTEAQAKKLIAEASVQRPALLGLLDINETALRKQAESLHDAMDVPGYEAREVQTAVATGKRRG